jgi:hypothetical protein
MNKLKWSILFIYASFVIISRVSMLTFLSQARIKKDIYILGWFSGLGNNIIQLSHAAYVSRRFGFTIHVPQHNFLKVEEKYLLHEIKPKQLQQKRYFPSTTAAVFLELQKQPNSFIASRWTLFRSLFYRFDILPYSPGLADYRNVLRKELLSIIPHHSDDTINEETLVIHIRSGDVFGDNLTTLHKGYIQPPLSFYLEIINRYGFKDIVIVTEKDLKNPCINQLRKIIPDIRIQTSDLPTDISTIMSARNLVVGHSSFSLCLGLASDKLKRMFIPQFDITKFFYHTRAHFWPNIVRRAFVSRSTFSNYADLDCDIRLIKILNYVPIGDWRNDQQQNKLMLEHSCEHILFK